MHHQHHVQSPQACLSTPAEHCHFDGFISQSQHPVLLAVTDSVPRNCALPALLDASQSRQRDKHDNIGLHRALEISKASLNSNTSASILREEADYSSPNNQTQTSNAASFFSDTMNDDFER
jgi:hypothetical protein